MTRRRTTLGSWLARWIALATAASIAVYAATTALVFWADEAYEDSADDNEPQGFDEEDAEELVTQLATALALAAPVGVALAALGARLLTARATRRIDEVIATAARMSAADLAARLPVSGTGDELDDLARALNSLFARIDAGIAAQRQFAADASHELRSPLTVLASTLEVARRRPRTAAEWETFADRAQGEVRHLNTLVDGLLQLARAGQLRLARNDLAGLADAAVARWSSVAGDAGVRLELAPAPDLELDVDADLLGVALGNLFANAIAHTPAGEAVLLRTERDGDAVLLHVDDAGPGVPPDQRERVFEPFVRRAAPAADRVQGRAGLGLGLAIVRRIAEAHGGSVRVTTAPTGGARFSLRLPLA